MAEQYARVSGLGEGYVSGPAVQIHPSLPHRQASFDRLREETSQCLSAIDELYKRLHPVLHSTDMVPTHGLATKAMSPISDAADEVGLIASRLRELIAKIDL